ncbi:unnamed protein product [Caenorhabditis sp. 36 PRJEB53466]|nr:unnamed protein product [Caenorhabditis sp. 36 PRJEB53466]
MSMKNHQKANVPSSVNLAIPVKKDKKRGGEAKSLGNKERKSSHADMAMVEVPGKREAPRKENKKIKIVAKKDPRKSTRRKKSSSLTAEEAPSGPSKSKNTSDEKSGEKKKEEPALPPLKNTLSSAEKRRKTGAKRTSKEQYFNMELAQKFFSQMIETQTKNRREQKTREEDSLMETMPESSQMSSASVRSTKNLSKRKKKKKKPLDRNIFRENGDPVWVVQDKKLEDQVVNSAGEKVKYPELMAALEEDGLEIEDGKGWLKKVTQYFEGTLNDGKMDPPAQEELDPFAPMDVLQEHNESFFGKECIVYNTTDNIINLSEKAIARFINGEDQGSKMRRNAVKEKKETEPATCVNTSISFVPIEKIYCIKYDRRRPITSIQKFRKKYMQEMFRLSTEQPTQKLSCEKDK